MDKNNENLFVWRMLQILLAWPLERLFNVERDKCDVEGPCLVIANHVSAWDPLLMALNFPKRPVHFVASEHIFRRGWVSKLLIWALAPIARRKASTAADTVMKCLRRLKAGQVVGLYAEGEACWDGVSHEVFPATGKLARTSNATLVTYRLEGGYAAFPRWTKKKRRGKLRFKKVGVYSPETLKAMKPEEITAMINRDIYENVWERQKTERISFRAKNRAEGIETGYFICPGCGRIDTAKGVGNRIVCSCGFDVSYTEECFLDPAEPFENLLEWENWQREKFNAMEFPEGELMFSDRGLDFKQIAEGHGETDLGKAELRQYPDRLECGDMSFDMKDISHMSMVKRKILLLSVGEDYFELRSDSGQCLRKYLFAWEKYQALK